MTVRIDVRIVEHGERRTHRYHIAYEGNGISGTDILGKGLSADEIEVGDIAGRIDIVPIGKDAQVSRVLRVKDTVVEDVEFSVNTFKIRGLARRPGRTAFRPHHAQASRHDRVAGCIESCIAARNYLVAGGNACPARINRGAFEPRTNGVGHRADADLQTEEKRDVNGRPAVRGRIQRRVHVKRRKNGHRAHRGIGEVFDARPETVIQPILEAEPHVDAQVCDRAEENARVIGARCVGQGEAVLRAEYIAERRARRKLAESPVLQHEGGVDNNAVLCHDRHIQIIRAGELVELLLITDVERAITPAESKPLAYIGIRAAQGEEVGRLPDRRVSEKGRIGDER